MTNEIILKRLSWAGVLLRVGEEQLVIDGLEGRNGEVQSRLGQPRFPLLPLSDTRLDLALVTHLHRDHFDQDALSRRLRAGAPVFVPEAAEADARATGLAARGVKVGETVQQGNFRITALPSVDGMGWSQVAWLVETDGLKIFHAGDTLFHGYWWEIAKRGPIDVAFLPINGAVMSFPPHDPSGLPGVMTAEQAAIAGRLLKAKQVVPIHYQEFHAPPAYHADLEAEPHFLAHATRQNIRAAIVRAGDAVDFC